MKMTNAWTVNDLSLLMQLHDVTLSNSENGYRITCNHSGLVIASGNTITQCANQFQEWLEEGDMESCLQ